MKWNLLFYTALSMNWGSLIKDDTKNFNVKMEWGSLCISQWKIPGEDDKVQSHNSLPGACNMQALGYLTLSQSLATTASKNNGSLRSSEFLCPRQLLHTKDRAFQPSPSPKSILELRQMGFMVLKTMW